MEKIKFKDFIQFAIAKEIGTAHFYTQAAEKAKNSETEELLLQFAREEEGHQRVLETLTVEKIDQATMERMPSIPRGNDAAVTEYRPSMSYAEIVKMAIAMEEQAFDLYDSLRDTADDDDLKKIFTFLAKSLASADRGIPSGHSAGGPLRQRSDHRGGGLRRVDAPAAVPHHVLVPGIGCPAYKRATASAVLA